MPHLRSISCCPARAQYLNTLTTDFTDRVLLVLFLASHFAFFVLIDVTQRELLTTGWRLLHWAMGISYPVAINLVAAVYHYRQHNAIT